LAISPQTLKAPALFPSAPPAVSPLFSPRWAFPDEN